MEKSATLGLANAAACAQGKNLQRIAEMFCFHAPPKIDLSN